MWGSSFSSISALLAHKAIAQEAPSNNRMRP